MTAVSALLGAYPMVFPTGAGAASRQSLGTAIFGGTFVATFLSLFVVPILYIVIGTIQQRLVRRKESNALPQYVQKIHTNSL